MPFEVIHPRDFPAKLGLTRVPTKPTLRTWRKDHGFPDPLAIPRGHYRLEEVQSWFASRPSESQSQAWTPERRATHAKVVRKAKRRKTKTT